MIAVALSDLAIYFISQLNDGALLITLDACHLPQQKLGVRIRSLGQCARPQAQRVRQHAYV